MATSKIEPFDPRIFFADSVKGITLGSSYGDNGSLTIILTNLDNSAVRVQFNISGCYLQYRASPSDSWHNIKSITT
jgi:hypothetical protein